MLRFSRRLGRSQGRQRGLRRTAGLWGKPRHMTHRTLVFPRSACLGRISWLARGQGGKPCSFVLLGLYRQDQFLRTLPVPCQACLLPCCAQAGPLFVSRQRQLFVDYSPAVSALGNMHLQARIMNWHAARCRSSFLWGAPPAAPVAVRPSSFQRPLHHVRLSLGELHSVSSTANRSWPPPGSLLARQA